MNIDASSASAPPNGSLTIAAAGLRPV
jgi:hypothetical protein